MLKYLNLGCGGHFHNDWTNIDFISNNENVIAYNLLEGIPYPDNEFNVVYHSHLLEHFPKNKAEIFIKECKRVLKPGGIIRIATPDLEQIIINYLRELNSVKSYEENKNYDWIMLELFDQMVRNESGGEMSNYLFQDKIGNEDFVYKRIGIEGKNLRKYYLTNKQNITSHNKVDVNKNISRRGNSNKFLKRSFYKNLIKKTLFKEEYKIIEDNFEYIKIGKFRLSGEIHQWMYDRYSLSSLLTRTGFKEIRIMSADESKINDWNKFQLDVINGEIRKPDSLFIEAIKQY